MIHESKKTTIFILVSIFVVTMCFSFLTLPKKAYGSTTEDTQDYIDDTEDTQDYIDDTEDTQDYDYSVRSFREIIIKNMTAQDCNYIAEGEWEIIYPPRTIDYPSSDDNLSISDDNLSISDDNLSTSDEIAAD